MSVRIHIPTPEEEEALGQECLAELGQIARERKEAVEQARPALERLAQVLTGRSGQPYKLRALLYSMWNGKPWTLNDAVCLDWQIHKDLVAVMLAWGDDDFFYSELEAAVRAVGQWAWFLEEEKNVELLAEYVESARRAE